MLINRLSRLMGDKRVNIAEVVRGTGISYSTIHDLYHDNRKRIDLRVLNALCNFFAVGPSEVFEWQPDAEQGAGSNGS